MAKWAMDRSFGGDAVSSEFVVASGAGVVGAIGFSFAAYSGRISATSFEGFDPYEGQWVEDSWD